MPYPSSIFIRLVPAILAFLQWRSIPGFVLAIVFLQVADSRSAEFYIDPNGDDSNPGTISQPFGSIAKGQDAASAGDTVWIRGGTYEYVAGLGASENAVLFNKSGSPGNRINYWAYPGETPVFDFFNYLPQERIRGFSVVADHLHFKGLELRGVQQTITNVNESWAIRVEGGGGDFNIFEELNLHSNEGPGLFIQNGGNNLVLNSDSHHNYDPDRGGENADGFGSHSNDDGNIFIGNRAWENSDDGYDFINSPGTVVLENSWAWRNGYIPDTSTAAGNGAGIKAGGFGLNSGNFPSPGNVPRHVVRNSVSFDNRVQGFYANHHPGGLDFVNNTAFDNGRGFDLLNDVDVGTWPADHYVRNNISFSNSIDLINDNQALIDDEFNTWNSGFGVSAADFLSTSSVGVDGPRQGDGSLPNLNFLRLAPTSGLIDAGEDQGLAFNGLAPDLGAFETTPTATTNGDFNFDRVVDGNDFLLWQRGESPNPLAGSDLTTWFNNYGTLITPNQLTLTAVADTTIEESQPDDNSEGAAPRLQVRSRDVAGTGRQNVSYIRFDLSGETAIYDAILSLTTNNTVSWNTGEVQVYGLNDVAGNTVQDWSESTLTYNSSGAEVPGDGDATTQDLGSIGSSGAENLWLLGDLPGVNPNPGGVDVDFSSSALAEFLRSRAGGLATIMLVAQDASDRAMLLGSRELTGDEPLLHLNPTSPLTSVPEPTTSALTLFGIYLIAGRGFTVRR